MPVPSDVKAARVRGTRLLQAADWPLMLGLMAAGLLFRLSWWSGYGLADDTNFRIAIASIVNDGVLANPYGYRVTWWLPTAVVCRFLGITEQALILPVTAISTLSIGLLYVFGKSLWGRAGGVIAALLLLVHPLDFSWSTMFANDFFLSFFAALAVFLFLRASDAVEPTSRRRLFFFSALSLFAAYHSKVAAVALGPGLLAVAWLRRDRLLPEVTTFVGVSVLLFGLGMLGSIALTGGPFGPYEIDMTLGGLSGPEAVKWNRLTWDRFWTYPRTLFMPDNLGDLMYSVYPHLLLLFALLAWPLGLRSSPEVWVWFLAVFLTLQLQMNRVDGVWVSMFRNIRHSHSMVYPMVLLLAGYFTSLRARLPVMAHLLLAAVLLYSGWTSVSAASKTRDAFSDGRSAAAYVAGLPPKPVYSDFQLAMWFPVVPGAPPNISFHALDADPAKRREQIAALTGGYLVTGGGREPYYGCYDCIPGADEVPRGRWKLLETFPGPSHPTPGRREPVRIWEAIDLP